MPHPLVTTKSFGYDILNTELQVKSEEKEYFDVFKQAYNNDYWQRGKGSLLPPPTGAFSVNIDETFKQRFVFRNVVKEVVERACKAFFAKSPNWRYYIEGSNFEELPEEQQDAMDDYLTKIDKALNSFWTKNKVSSEMAKSLSSRLVTGRGGIRIYIPKSKVTLVENEDGTITEIFNSSSLEDALNSIRVEFVEPEQSRLLDEDGDFLSLVKYKIRNNWEKQDFSNVIEFSFVDSEGKTFVGLVKEKEQTRNSTSELPVFDYITTTGLDLKGKTTFFEISGKPYVTEALYKNNQLLNLALTCAGFSLVENGFGEVFVTNVEMQTKKVVGPDGEIIEEPIRLKRGGGAVQNLIGIRQTDEEGNENFQSPGVHFKDPTALETFRVGKDIAYRACLEESSQLYALISGDAVASGESRKQAMVDFLLRISDYKYEVDQLGSWLMTTVLSLAHLMVNKSNLIEVSYDSKIYIGELSNEEKAALREFNKQGLISNETCRVLIGVEDPELEREQIKKESTYSIEKVSLDEATRRAALANQLIGLLPEKRIRKVALGYSDEELEKIQRELEEDALKMNLFQEQQQRGITLEEGEEERAEL